MQNRRIVAGLLAVLGVFFNAFAIISLEGPAYAQSYIRNNVDGSQTLTNHVPREVVNATASFKSHVLYSQPMDVRIILPLENQNALSALLKNLYDPKSPEYHHFLTPVQFAQQFGASTIDALQIQEFLYKQGITVRSQSLNGTVLDATGPAGAFEHAFGLHINNYQNADGTKFYAPDADPTVPATLAGKVLAVGGLDNLSRFKPHLHALSHALPKSIGSGPLGYLAPSDVKTAYNLNSVSANGAGQNVALFELDGYSSTDVSFFENYFSLPNVPLQNVYIDQFSGTPDYTSGGADEVTLDIETVAAFAPGSKNIYVYEAANTTQAWMDEWTRMYTDDIAKIISCSWGQPEEYSPTLAFDNSTFEEMAAQGQAVFVAAGDNGAYDAGGDTLAVDEPASVPYATAVGISRLRMNAGYTYKSESASIYGGGGISSYYSIPAYQTTLAAQAIPAALVSTTMRNVPDVVLTADNATPYSFYIDGSWGGWYGSSIASPIWASFISRVNQAIGLNAPIGSVNSALYQLAQTSSYTNDFHDISTGNNLYYPAEPGFDDATGLGSFNGLNLFNDLVKNYAPGPLLVSITTPASGSSLTAGASLTITATASEVNGTVSSVAFYNGTTLLGTINTAPYRLTVVNVAAGTYTLTAIATDTHGVTSSSSPVTVTVNALPVVSITSPANNATYIAGSSLTITATASETNGTISNVSFYNGTTLLGVSNSVPYTYTITNLSTGSYTLTAKATDANGVSTTSSAVTVTVSGVVAPEIIDNTDPSRVIITGVWTPSTSFPGYYGINYIHDGNTLKGTKSVKYTPNLAGGAGLYQVFIRYTADSSRANNVPIDIVHSGVTTTVSLNQQINGGTWVLLGAYNFLANGSGESLTIRTTSTNGYVIADAVEFTTATVVPSAPVVSIINPLNASTFAADSTVTITANASETNGAISKVAFYNGSTLLGTSTSSPSTYTWSNVSPGTYILTAVATDANGISVTSSGITITVAAVNQPEIIDNTDPNKVLITGVWTPSTSFPGYYGINYIHDGNTLKGTKSVKYTPSLSSGPGAYQVLIRYTSDVSRASNVPVDIAYSGTITTVTVNQQINGGIWVSLGTYNFLANGSGEGLTIRTTSTNGYVIADAVEFIKQ